MLLKDTTDLIPLKPEKLGSATKRPESPSSVLGLVTSTPTVAHAIKVAGEAFLAVMDNPLSNVPKSIVPTGKPQ